MLSRVADTLYWLGRYIERAENNARILDVNLQVTLDDDNAGDIGDKRDWEPILATLTEFRLLHFLASNKGMVHSRRAMLAKISDSNILAADRTIDVHIRNLRRKIKPYDQHIEAIRGVGYRFRESALEQAVAS